MFYPNTGRAMKLSRSKQVPAQAIFVFIIYPDIYPCEAMRG